MYIPILLDYKNCTELCRFIMIYQFCVGYLFIFLLLLRKNKCCISRILKLKLILKVHLDQIIAVSYQTI